VAWGLIVYDFASLKCFVKMSPMKEMVTLNKKEQNRLMVLNWAERGMMTAKEATQILGLTLRQVKGILAAYRKEDAVALVHGNYGRNLTMP
jgi:hypothetical protein